MRNLNGEWVQIDLLNFIRYAHIESVQILANRDLILIMKSGTKHTITKATVRNDILVKGLGFKLKTNGN